MNNKDKGFWQRNIICPFPFCLILYSWLKWELNIVSTHVLLSQPSLVWVMWKINLSSNDLNISYGLSQGRYGHHQCATNTLVVAASCVWHLSWPHRGAVKPLKSHNTCEYTQAISSTVFLSFPLNTVSAWWCVFMFMHEGASPPQKKECV